MLARFLCLRFTGLWRHSDFLKLWAGQTVSQFGSLITGFALPLAAIVLLKASPAQVALLSAAGTVPQLLLGLFAGVWVDRQRRRPLLILTDIGRALVVGSVPAAALLGLLHIEQLYAVALLSSALTVLFEVAYPAYLPSLLRPAELVEGNSKLKASNSVAEVAGFGLAGMLVQALTAPIAIAVDALSFVCSALSLLFIRAREPAPSFVAADVAQLQPPSPRNLWREIGDGLRFTLGNPVPRALAAATGIFTLCGYMLEVVLLLYLLNATHLPPALIGWIWGLGGISAFLGALVAERVTRRLGIGRAITWGLLIYTGSAVLIPLASGPAWLAVTLLALQQFSDAAHTIYNIGQTSLLQIITPTPMLGRLHASIRFIEGIATLGGLALGGVLGQTIGLRPTLFVAALGMLLAPLVVALSPVLRLRDVDEPLIASRTPVAMTEPSSR